MLDSRVALLGVLGAISSKTVVHCVLCVCTVRYTSCVGTAVYDVNIVLCCIVLYVVLYAACCVYVCMCVCVYVYMCISVLLCVYTVRIHDCFCCSCLSKYMCENLFKNARVFMSV